MVLKIGSALGGRYEIISRIGSGGMSDVYKARDVKLNRFVAIKVLKDDYAQDQTFVAKFRMEAQSAACLSNPNIVNIYDVGDEMGIYYIVMELIEGITLKRYIERKGKLGVREAIEVAIQVTHGLIAAHAEKIVHRDIKPQNIMISKEGKIKVTDFGIARAASTKTISSSTMGSVHYISPEQARGGFCDERSDIYSLGIMLYEMLTGRVPFEGENSVAVALLHIQGEMVPPREYEPSIPAGLEKIILKCTRKRPEARYATAALLLEDFKRVLASPDGDIDVDEDEGPGIITYGAGAAHERTQTAAHERTQAAHERTQTAHARSSERIEEARYQMGEEAAERQEKRPDPVPAEPAEADPADRRERRFEKIVTYIGVGVAIAVAAVVTIIVLNITGVLDFGGGGSAVTEPVDELIEIADLTGKTYEEADRLLSGQGVTIKATYRKDSSYPEGTIIDQDIVPGTLVPSGSVMNVVICLGETSLEVPEGVSGLSTSRVREMLEEAGFTNVNSTYYEEYSDTVDQGLVIRLDPESGNKVAADAAITIVVSRGKAVSTVNVPSVTGYSEEEARDAISGAGLAVGVISEEYSTTVSKGKVISQRPEAGSAVSEGTSVSFVVSKGQEGVRVPDLEGLTLEEATRRLQDVGLLLGDVDREESEDDMKDLVIGQTPEEGAPLAKSKKVDLVIGTGRAAEPTEPTSSAEPTEPSSSGEPTEPSSDAGQGEEQGGDEPAPDPGDEPAVG